MLARISKNDDERMKGINEQEGEAKREWSSFALKSTNQLRPESSEPFEGLRREFCFFEL